ncbi:FYVE-domain-containing protein [Pholiota conissans]|uniref:FYVE-domain-containing protein n=1 Tax=Pholiota conissans TaxID=109636 RepID=A0A9P5ZDC9_9AGAR|nr:FYVE-domain-containing protein [Pholiota conissans]
MSAPSSPPTNPAYVPYQAYKSKRHSRNLSNNSHLVPNQSPPLVSRPATTLFQSQPFPDSGNNNTEEPEFDITPLRLAEMSNEYSSSISVVVDPPLSPDQPSSGPFTFDTASALNPNTRLRAASGGEGSSGTMYSEVDVIATTSQTSSGSILSGASTSTSAPKKVSTFRRLPVKKNHPVHPTPHTRNVSTGSLPPRLLPDQPLETPLNDTRSSPVTPHISSTPAVTELEHFGHSGQPLLEIRQSVSQSSRSSTINASRPSSTPSQVLSPNVTLSPKSASYRPPYRPGFQPKGVYRPLTDEFITRRRSIHDGEGENGMARVERTKLERRLEKLIALHFPHQSSPDRFQRGDKDGRPGLATFGHESRRASSFFDFQTLNAGELWRGVITGGLGDAAKMDIRAQEQRITPWQDDAAVSKCPLCSATFHPLTNRKHHCRLCGQIICSLPIKHPQRKASCSTLFVVDTNTREIEEVGEGVDYGVRRRKTSIINGPQSRQEEEDKFLKGVRICRECRPILLRQQYYQQARNVPLLTKMYERFVHLEADIEEYLPKFQELLMTLSHHDQPTREASAARKNLLESFAQYDRLSKEIRALPCPNGPGSSQDRVQAAIMTRANIFLQKNMFPLQSLPTPKSNNKGNKSAKDDASGTIVTSTYVDPDSAVAHALQPLLEQETLLESFVEEAQAQRKFEDVKTLKMNLAEIRQEIEKILSGKRI